jgi:mannose-6-phosphate isomerase-like protein (cupin superfamily)
MGELTSDDVLTWVEGYEREWRAQRADRLDELFTADAAYLAEPYAAPVEGLDALRRWWSDEMAPGEVFTLQASVVACSGRTAVVRALVRYGDPVTQEYLDLWVVTFDESGRATRFEEWPFWPTQGRAPLRPDPRVMAAAEVPATPYGEVVRSWALSAGVYRVGAGAEDHQSPHGEDEVYVVTAGAALLEVDGDRRPVGPGTVAYVPRRVPHRFVEISEDLEVAVVFAPPEGSV